MDTNHRFRSGVTRPSLVAIGVCLAMAACTAHADRINNYGYTETGLLEAVDGPRTDVEDATTFNYDTFGNRTSTTNALGHVTRYTHYDEAGRLLRMVDPNGLVASFTYHPRGWILTRTSGEGDDARTMAFDYDAVGNLTKLTLPTGGYVEYRYDTANRLAEVVDSTGNRITYTYNPLGEVTAEAFYDTNGKLRRTLSRIYDSLNLLHQSLDADGHATTYGYDANGNRIGSSDPLSRQNGFFHDELNRLVKQVGPLSGETHFAYDARDNLIAVTNPSRHVTSYEYNAFDERTKEISPDRGVTTYSYDDAGNLLEQTDARGVTVSHFYDALNRRTATSYPSSAENIIFTYDEGINGMGRLTGIAEASGQTQYRYDKLGQLIEDRHVIDGLTFTVSYAYDDNGQLSNIGYPSGGQLHYRRDALGRIMQVDWQPATGNLVTLAEAITYEPFGPLRSLVYGNGLLLQRNYDANYRLMSQSVGHLMSDSYAFDLVGNVSAWTDLLDAAENQAFTYDDLDRLQDANGPWGSWVFSHDLVGNRALLNQGATLIQYDYDDSLGGNQLATANPPFRAYTYDAAGNVLDDGRRTFSYNEAGRMASATNGTTVAHYRYNARGERVSKTVDGVTSYFRYSVDGQLLGEYDSNGAPIREYSYLDGQPLALLSSGAGGVAFYHNDHLGTPRILTDENAAIVWEATRLPFGETWITTQRVVNPVRFPGQYFDEETGLHYNYFRDYDPRTGRYVQSDPIGLGGGLNTYAYVGGNPIRKIDPLGLVEWSGSQVEFGAAVGVGGLFTTLTLESECVNGQMGKATVWAVGPSIGLSAGVKDFPELPGGSSPSVQFEDNFSHVDPRVFDGFFSGYWAGVMAAPFKLGFNITVLGGAHAVGVSPSYGFGLGAGYSYTVGSSTVISSSVEPCGCK